MASYSGIESFLAYRRIAFIGVSTSPTCPTRELLRSLVARGQEVAPIRSGVSEIEGIKAYPTLEHAGDVDGVVIMMSGRNVGRALEDCLDAGVRSVWLIGEDVAGSAAAFAAAHRIELVITRDPSAALDLAVSLLQRLTARLRRIAS
jgi:predicted CoA-binding protein